MIKLDAAPKRKLIGSITGSAIFLFICFWVECIPSKGKHSKTTTYPDYNIDPVGFVVVLIVFAVLLGLIIVTIVTANAKGVKKRKTDSGICRDPSLVFNYNDPESIIETLILYQDYTGNQLNKSLYKNNLLNTIVFNMFKKLGWTREEDGKLYIKNVDNNYLQYLCIRPLDNTIQAFSQAQEFNNQEWFDKKIEAPGNYKTVEGDTLIYDIDKMTEYSSKVFKCIEDSARRWCQGKGIKESFKVYNGSNANRFENMALSLTRWRAGSNNEGIDYAEKTVKEKYFAEKTVEKARKESKKSESLTGIYVLSAILAIAFLIVYHVFGQNATFNTKALINFICVVFGLSLGNLFLYSKSLIREAGEELNPDGQEIIDRIYGLKRFIEEYTQLKNPSSDNVYRVWDEFAFFAGMFGLNDKLLNVAKENGMEYDNEKVLEYFEANETMMKVIATNYNVCGHVPYPCEDDKQWKIGYMYA